MRTTALTRTHRRTAGAGTTRATGSRSLSGIRRTRTLKDRFAALGHYGARRLRCGSRPWRRRIDGSRAGLWNNQAARRRRGPLRRRYRLGRSRGRRLGRYQRSFSASGIGFCQGRSRGFHQGRFHHRLRNCRLRLNCHRSLRFHLGFDWFGCFFDGRRNDRRRSRCHGDFRRNHHCRRRTRNSLRSNKARRGFGRFNRRNRSCTGGHNGRLGDCAGRTRRHGGWRSHTLAHRYAGSRGSRTRRNSRLRGLLCDRFQHVSRFGDM